MSIRLETLLVLLQQKLSSLNLNPRAADNPRPIEIQLAADLYKSVQKMDRQDYVEMTDTEELYESAYQSEDFEPVFEDLEQSGGSGGAEEFSSEYINKVLTFVDENPGFSFKTIRTKTIRLKYHI